MCISLRASIVSDDCLLNDKRSRNNVRFSLVNCYVKRLKGRAQLVASNLFASVTISGDFDAIDLVEPVMQDESKFARKLKVDTAYHCFHMRVCSMPYVEVS